MSLAESLKSKHNITASHAHVGRLLRVELGLSYKNITALDHRTNTLRSLRLRQLYAMNMLEAYG